MSNPYESQELLAQYLCSTTAQPAKFSLGPWAQATLSIMPFAPYQNPLPNTHFLPTHALSISDAQSGAPPSSFQKAARKWSASTSPTASSMPQSASGPQANTPTATSSKEKSPQTPSLKCPRAHIPSDPLPTRRCDGFARSPRTIRCRSGRQSHLSTARPYESSWSAYQGYSILAVCFILNTPLTWLEEFTPEINWIGGTPEGGETLPA